MHNSTQFTLWPWAVMPDYEKAMYSADLHWVTYDKQCKQKLSMLFIL